MKHFIKPLSVLLCLILMLGVFAVASAAEAYVMGDADGNGNVEIVDATVVMRVMAYLVTDTDGSIAKRCNINGNGMDITSATWIQRYLAEMDIPYPVGQPVTEAPTQKPTRDYELPPV